LKACSLSYACSMLLDAMSFPRAVRYMKTPRNDRTQTNSSHPALAQRMGHDVLLTSDHSQVAICSLRPTIGVRIRGAACIYQVRTGGTGHPNVRYGACVMISARQDVDESVSAALRVPKTPSARPTWCFSPAPAFRRAGCRGVLVSEAVALRGPESGAAWAR
jgi:hypothetical protein